MNIKTQINSNRAITLIALVITIIVLLILAGITINTIMSNNSAINKASEARILTEKGEISDALSFSVLEISTKSITGTQSKEDYYKDQPTFEREGKFDGTNYPISSYIYENSKVTLDVSKLNGTNTIFTFEIDTDTNQITCTSHQEPANNGGSTSGGTNEISTETYTDAGFYVEGDTTGQFNPWFDKDLGTDLSRATSETVIVKWTGNLTGKQLYVKTGRSAATSGFEMYYIDANGNILNTYNCNYESTQYANYTNESVTYVPEGAVGLRVVDDNYGYNIYEIQLFESGKYTNNNLISNIQKVGVTSNKIGFKWNQDASVKSVKVYKDGQYLGQTSDKEFLITSYITASEKYDFYLEPVTEESEQTPNFKYEKTKFNLETQQGTAGFYIANLNEIERKYYASYIDANTDTYLSVNSLSSLKIKWKGNISGKQIYVKGGRSAPVNDFAIYYKDANGNTLNTYNCNYENTQYVNYTTETVTYVPEGAVELLLVDTNYGYNFYEISLLENGTYWDDHITNITATEIGKHSITLSWNKDANVQKTKIYQDGLYLGETDGTTYSITGGLLTNTEYTYAFEPITAESVNGVTNKKILKAFTTQSDGADFYIEGTNNISKKYYKNWFDTDKTTYINRQTRDRLTIKWTGNLAGRQIYTQNDRSAPLDDFCLRYIDADGNFINAIKTDGQTTTYLTYQTEAITVVPEGAVGISLIDYNYGYNFFEICLAEEISGT